MMPHKGATAGSGLPIAPKALPHFAARPEGDAAPSRGRYKSATKWPPGTRLDLEPVSPRELGARRHSVSDENPQSINALNARFAV